MNYSAIFIPSEPGKKDFELAAGSFADVAGNTNDLYLLALLMFHQ